MLIAVGGLCYYIGDNLTNLITEYGGELDCGPECIEGVQIFGIAMLGAATVTYLPVLTDVFSERVSEQTESGKKITQARIVVLLLLAKLTDVDLVYDAIERAASNKCNKVMIGAWVYYGVYLSVFLCFTVYRMWNVIKETKNTAAQEEKCGCMHTCTRILEVVMGFLVFVFAASYILADNRLPLACTIINEINQDIVRLILQGATFILGLVVLVCWCIYIYIKGYVKAKNFWGKPHTSETALHNGKPFVSKLSIQKLCCVHQFDCARLLARDLACLRPLTIILK